MTAFHEMMFHARPDAAFTADLVAWVAVTSAADDAAIKAVRMARSKAKLSHAAPYQRAFDALVAASNRVAKINVGHNARSLKP